LSETKKIAARAHVIPNMTFKHPRHGGLKASKYCWTKERDFKPKPDWPIAAAFHSGKQAIADTPEAAK